MCFVFYNVDPRIREDDGCFVIWDLIFIWKLELVIWKLFGN
jgi:hypothetical protein